jgi:hypothetical protein
LKVNSVMHSGGRQQDAGARANPHGMEGVFPIRPNALSNAARISKHALRQDERSGAAKLLSMICK